jgi:hypothetical protein
MIRRAALIATCTMAAALVSGAADLPDRWRSWRYSRAVQENSSSKPRDPGGSEEILLPWDLFAHSNSDLSDLRMVDDKGREVPYELRIDRGQTRVESHAAHILENSFVAGQYTQVIGDLGPDAPFFDRVHIETAWSDFIVWAEVALSDDAKTWRIVEPRAPIARFQKRAVEGTQTIPFQGLNSRYIRLRIFDTQQQFGVTSLTALREQSRPAVLSEVPSTFLAANSDDTTESSWTTELRSSRLPVSRLIVASATPEFYRAVRISGSDDGKTWNYRGSGVIFRYKQAGKTRESLAIDFPEWQQNRLLRVDVINGNDQPLRGLALVLLAVPRVAVFRPQSGSSYRVLYGNERAKQPEYDLAHFLETVPKSAGSAVMSLGPEQATANYTDPRPFSERHPETLWISLAIAVVLIGLTALKTLRTSRAAGSG